MTDRPDPRTTALLIMDYQPAILGRLPDPEAQLARAVAALDVARRRGAHVGFVRVAFTPDDVRRVPAHSRFAAVAPRAGAFGADSPATQVHPALAPRPDDVQVRKTRVGAFSTTDLHEQLQARGVQALVLAGISTSGVVLSTLRDASDRDYRLFVLQDASTDVDAEVHAFLCGRIFPRQATVLDTPELDRLLA